MERRNFIRNAGRFAWLGMLAAYALFEVQGRKDEPSGECRLTDGCRHCRSLASCGLPQAVRLRSEAEGIQN